MTTKLDAIRAREQAATRAPWETNVQSQYAAEVVAPCPCCGLVAKRVFPWDAEFIAHARADIPLLLAVAEAAAEWRQAELDWTTINDEFQLYDGNIAGLNEIADRMCATEESIEALKDTLMTAIAPLLEEGAE